ncbi:MAG: hypothetical protein MR516_04755 [Bacteroidales bacterium]|nr:hypothetical protein [Bacteroidales bacterium]
MTKKTYIQPSIKLHGFSPTRALLEVVKLSVQDASQTQTESGTGGTGGGFQELSNRGWHSSSKIWGDDDE